LIPEFDIRTQYNITINIDDNDESEEIIV
jgi:hypothetical protein